jgi:hypothetical protein
MRKTIVTAFASFVMAALLPASPGNAAVYSFTFSSSDVELTATAEITVNGSDEVTAISGKISGLVDQTITGVTVNPNFPNPAYSSDGSFIYNNMYYKSNTVFDTYGLLFGTAQNAGGYWNLWGISPGVYSLYESRGSYNYPIQKTGTLTVAAAPELSTWAMLGLGFAGLSLARRRRAQRLADRGLT